MDANVRVLLTTLHLREVVGGERNRAKDPLKNKIPGAGRPVCGAVLEMGSKQECVQRKPVMIVNSPHTTDESCPILKSGIERTPKATHLSSPNTRGLTQETTARQLQESRFQSSRRKCSLGIMAPQPPLGWRLWWPVSSCRACLP